MTQPTPEPEMPELDIQIVDLSEPEEIPAISPPPPAGDSGTGAGERKKREEPRTSSTKAPTAEEWQGWFAGTVLRGVTELYLHMVLFRHIPEEDLSPRELEMVKLTKDELWDIAAPLGSVASKNRLARKHGRAIIATSESYESFIDVFFWMKRVNSIARKYRQKATIRNPETGETMTEDMSYGVPRTDATTPGTGNESIDGRVVNRGGIFNRGTG